MTKQKKERSLFRKIVNGFMTGVVVIIALALIAFGFSQTETFRDYLKNEIENRLSEEMNGKFSIGELRGTIFTSLHLKDVNITLGEDTLLTSETIETVVNPVHLALDKIYIRKFEISNTKINFTQNDSGQWNYDLLFSRENQAPDSRSNTNSSDSSASSFPYLLQIVNADINNLSFSRRSFEYRDSLIQSNHFNVDNLLIDSVNLDLSAVANLNQNEFAVDLKSLSAKTNFGGFVLNKFSGLFHLTDKFAEAKKLNIATNRSDIYINARLDSVNLFAPVVYENFEKYPIKLTLNANSFDFEDLSSFLESTDILRGKADLDLALSGNFGDFEISKLKLDYGDSHFDIFGRMKKLHTPEHLYMDLQFNRSSVGLSDAAALLPEIGIPTFDGLVFEEFTGIYKGEPTNFHSELNGTVDGGQIETRADMNITAEPISYDFAINSSSLNIDKIIGIPTQLNSKILLKGKGTSPSDISSRLSVEMEKSTINGYDIDSLNLTADLLQRNFELLFTGLINDSKMSSKGTLEFPENSAPRYNLIGDVKALDISKFTEDSTTFSSLNFNYDFNGKSFNIDSMSGQYVLSLAPSIYNEYLLDESVIKLVLNSDSTDKEIKLTSRFVDVNIDGEFSLDDAIKITSYQGASISKIFTDKINELNPLNILEEKDTTAAPSIKTPDYAYKDLYVNYNFNFKDFDLIGKIIGAEKLNIAGGGEGSISNDSTNFSLSTKLNIDYLIDHTEQNSVYISGLNADLDFNRSNKSQSFENFFGSFTLDGKRIYSGMEIQKLNADFVFNGSKIFFNNSMIIDTSLTTAFEGIIYMKPSEQEIIFDNLEINYNNIPWSLKEPVSLFFNPNYINLYGLKLFHEDASVEFSGFLRSSGVQDIFITVDDLPAELIGNYFSDDEQNYISGTVEAITQINGSLSDPVISTDLSATNVGYKGVNFGSLIFETNYSNKLLDLSLNFVDSTSGEPHTLMNAAGHIPIDLGVKNAGERLINDEDIDLHIYSNDFNINIFADLLPLVHEQRGLLTADISVGGNYDQIQYDGYLNLSDGIFKARANNLTYRAGMNFKLEGNNIEIDSFKVTNAGGSQYSGTINGDGELKFSGFSLDSADISLTGDLALLGPASNTGETNYSGNLLVGTDDAWKLSYNNNAWLLQGVILLKRTDVQYVTTESRAGTNTASFNYQILEDSTAKDTEEIRYKTYLEDISLTESGSASDDATQFNYDVIFRMQQIGNIQFIFSQLANQKLSVEATGEIKFEKNNNQSVAQGEFVLLEGSKLEFFKTFEASGTIRFESDLTNPYLDVVATYASDYTDPTSESGATEDVAVKIILNSPLNELGQKFAGKSDNILVYKGARNIADNISDNRYDAADALSFVLVGKFTDDLTASDKTSAAYQTSVLTNTATSLLGSVLSNYINSALGDVVNNIQLSNSSNVDRIRFNVSGRIQNIRYRIGGTTEVFENINKADLRIEYLFSPRFLIRLERKRPLIETYGIDEKINELGLKYKFIF